MKQTLYCTIAILIYFVLIIIKRKFFKETDKSGKVVLNIVLEIVMFLAFTIAIAYIAGFRLNMDNKYWSNFLTERGSDVVWTLVAFIVATTFLTIVKTLLVHKRTKIKNLTEEERKILEKRTTTMTKVLISLFTYATYIVLIIVILGIWGVNVMPALAGLGIAGLVIGLGAQKLIGDFVSGIFIVFEHHFDVGDTIEVDDFKGTVIDIGLKTTKIKNWEGKVKIIANSELSSLINFSLDNTTFGINIPVAYSLDPTKVMEKLDEGYKIRFNNRDEVITVPHCSGVNALDDSSVNILVVGTTKSESQYQLIRDIKQATKEICEENNFEIPFQQIVIYQGDK